MPEQNVQCQVDTSSQMPHLPKISACQLPDNHQKNKNIFFT